jgi:phospholipid transport system substrate-binding protein
MRLLIVVATLGLLLPGLRPARADDSTAPVAFIRQVGNEIPGVLANATTIEQRRARLRPFVARVVDVDATAQFCLGRYWAHATPAQQQALQTLFLTVLVNEIALWTGDSTNPATPTTVTMQPAVTVSGQTYVPTIVNVGIAPPAHVNWVVNMHAAPPRILDVTAEGLSLRETLHSDFVSYLNRHGGNIDGLIGVLQQRARDSGGLGTTAPAFAPSR